MESRAHALEMATALKEMTGRLGLPFVFKSSFDKANRTSLSGARGIGLDTALAVFAEIRETLGLPVLTDVHDADAVRAGGRGGRHPADPRLPLPPDGPAASPRRRRGASSTSRRGSSSRRGT